MTRDHDPRLRTSLPHPWDVVCDGRDDGCLSPVMFVPGLRNVYTRVSLEWCRDTPALIEIQIICLLL